MSAVRERSAAAIVEHGVGDGVVPEMVVRHELQHTETMRQTMALAGLLPAGEPSLRSWRRRQSRRGGRVHETEGWLELPAERSRWAPAPRVSPTTTSAPATRARTGAFRIARRPVSNASWLRFSEGGGYERREWWSDEGWAWKEEYDITHHHAAISRATRRRPSATSAGSRPTPSLAHTVRACPPRPSGRGRRPGSSGIGAAIGRVWEWTASHFGGYPGFVAHPYREYSEVFFGEHYRVLRGGSWATSPRVASLTFRNWDLPQRRQIFAGVRLARECDVHGPRQGSQTRHPHRLPPRRGPGALARRGRAGRADPALQGTASQALLRRARRRAVRPICELPEYYPTRTERAILDATGRGDRRADRRRGAGRAGLGHGRQDARAAGRPAPRRARWSATCRWT